MGGVAGRAEAAGAGAGVTVFAPAPARRVAARSYSTARLAGWADRFGPAVFTLLTAGIYLWAHTTALHSPSADRPGWTGWYDQMKYLEAMRAWSAWDFRPLHHWYMPGYPLLGAAFHALTPSDPFVLPNLVSLVLSSWLFAHLGARLAGGVPGARAASAAVFLGTVALVPAALGVWVVPWTSTPTAALTFSCLLAAVRFADRPAPLPCALATFAGAGLIGFRILDAAIVAGPAGLLMLWGLARAWPGRREGVWIVAAGLAGAALPVAVWVASHVAVHGWAPGGYMELAARFGFEWRLLPLRWVAVVLGPVPLFLEGHGLVAQFPWIAPGVAGLAACLLAPGRAGRAVHLAVAAAVALLLLFTLAFRDLHPYGLWRYHNYHYFKWALPLLGLYAVLLLAALAGGGRRRRAGLAGLALTAPLFLWRPELHPADAPAPVVQGPHDLWLPGGFADLHDAVLVPADGVETDIYHGEHVLSVAGRRFDTPHDARAFPRPGGALLVPLRELPAGPVAVRFGRGVVLDPAVPAISARRSVRFGLPCWTLRRRVECRPTPLLPGRPVPLDTPVPFDRTADPYLMGGWSSPDPDGRWTDGRGAGLSLRLADLPPGQDVVLDVEAGGYVPARGGRPTEIGVVANGVQVAGWGYDSGVARTKSVRIPARLLGPNGALVLRFTIENPRRPVDHGDGGDTRNLGLHVRGLRLRPVPAEGQDAADPAPPVLHRRD